MLRVNLENLSCVVVLAMVGGCSGGAQGFHYYNDATLHEGLTPCLQAAELAPDPMRARSDCLNAVPRARSDR